MPSSETDISVILADQWSGLAWRMGSDSIEAIVFLFCVFASAIATIWIRRRKFVYIVDYQAGVRFDGKSSRRLPPGLYLSNPNSAPITIVDLRPRQFIFEGRTYHDALASGFLMSVAGEFRISIPELAITSFKNPFDESLTIIQEGLQSATSRLIVATDAQAREDLASRLTSELNRELQQRGIDVRPLEITELSMQRTRHQDVALAN